MSEPQRISSDELPPLTFAAGGDDDDIREANLQAVLPSPGYPTAVLLMADAISKRADVLLMDFTAANISVRYQVDGLWHNMPAMERTVGDYMLATIKQLGSLNFRERRARQVGTFTVKYLREKFKCRITSQGISAGERVAIEIDRPKPSLEYLEEIGMRRGMRDELVQAINQPGGLVLVSSLPGDGLSTTWRAMFQSCDRFTRDFFVIEEASRVDAEIINVTSVTYDTSKGENILTPMRGVMLREPQVVAFSELPDAAALNYLTMLANKHEITTVAGLHAKHAVEAVVRALMLKPDVAEFAEALRVVVAQRIVRKLCESCREAFQPNPNLIAQLGLPAGRVPVLYRHFQPSQEQLMDERGNPIELDPCPSCGGPGYFERIGIFELLHVNDRFRDAIQANPSMQNLTAVARQSGHISLRDEGVVAVASGKTSLEELQRVLKK